ncbi:MAG: DUF2062 domain-containing protein [Puniceicoccales bacterium]|jgi:uncharacterized protein (DUF2062 family)|nr:DUF2062 domain-containing protein [Puniceicoccales bacterium]
MCDGGDANRERDSKLRRIRFVKKILRRLPRKASLHRYPILNKFADAARKRSYLWSFRVSEVVPAFYLGWIITLMPIPSFIQIIIAFFVAMVCRANAVILMFLQLLSNVATCLFLWFVTHKVGAFVVNLLGSENLRVMPPGAAANTSHPSERALRIVATMILGAIVLGSILGAISSEIYKYFARKYASDCSNRPKE